MTEQRKSTSRNPLITTIFTADPSAHVWNDGRIYIYVSHDIDPARGCDLMDKYHAFSSSDMVNWQDEGEILSSDDVSWGRPEGGFMWAPDCAFKNGVYYFYYPHPSDTKWNNTWKIGVATSKKPASGFVDQGYIEDVGGFAMIDPCVFIDDDKKAYFYYGGGGYLGGCYGAELSDDMLSLKTKLKRMRFLRDFHEAAWVFKREGWYYLIYSDNLRHRNRYRYAMSRNPLGPWKYKGIFLDPVGCETTHGSIVEFKGQWYLFYHNQTISGEGNLRSVCVDYVYFNPDSTIKKVIQTKEGVKLAGEHAPTNHPTFDYGVEGCIVKNGAYKIKTSKSGDKVIVLDSTQEDSYCEYQNLEGGTGGRAEISFYCTTIERKAKLQLQINGTDYSLINIISSGHLEGYPNRAFLTVNFKPGDDNSIKLTSYFGKIYVHSISVKLLDM